MTDLNRQLADLLASIRAASTAMADPTSNFIRNAQITGEAYAQSPQHAVYFIAQIAAVRLNQINEALAASGQATRPFPRDELLACIPKTSAYADGVDFLEEVAASLVPEPGPVDALIARHGLLGFSSLVHIANQVGVMLTEVDPRFDDLDDLLAQEALADELEAQEMLGD